VSNLFKDYGKVKEYIKFIFNKFKSQEDIKNLAAGVNSVLENLNSVDGNDQKYKAFLSHLYTTLKKQ
jgi:hypothetical protein